MEPNNQNQETHHPIAGTVVGIPEAQALQQTQPAQMPVVEVRRSRFVQKDELQQIDLGQGDWVKIPARFSYAMSESFQFEDDPRAKINSILQVVIKDWNLVDADGTKAPITIEKIKQLSAEDFETIFQVILEKIEGAKIPKGDASQSTGQ